MIEDLFDFVMRFGVFLIAVFSVSVMLALILIVCYGIELTVLGAVAAWH